MKHRRRRRPRVVRSFDHVDSDRDDEIGPVEKRPRGGRANETERQGMGIGKHAFALERRERRCRQRFGKRPQPSRDIAGPAFEADDENGARRVHEQLRGGVERLRRRRRNHRPERGRHRNRG